jgi:rhomboid protease GluP
VPTLSYSVIRQTWLSQKPAGGALIVTLAVTFLMILLSHLVFQNVWNLQETMIATPIKVFAEHEWGKLWTTLFVHADLRHLLSNSFLFFILGYFLAGYFGIIIFPLTALIFGGVTNAIVLSRMPDSTALIGMSGVVFWMGGAWLSLYLLLDRRRSFSHRLLRAMGVGLMLFFPAESFDPQISYSSHFVGFGLGVVWGLFYFFLKKKEFRQKEEIEIIHEEI